MVPRKQRRRLNLLYILHAALSVFLRHNLRPPIPISPHPVSCPQSQCNNRSSLNYAIVYILQHLVYVDKCRGETTDPHLTMYKLRKARTVAAMLGSQADAQRKTGAFRRKASKQVTGACSPVTRERHIRCNQHRDQSEWTEA